MGTFSNPADIVRQCGVSQGMAVGDFGTGAGQYAHLIAAAVAPHGTVYAFDIQKDLLKRLEGELSAEEAKNVHPLWVDLEDTAGTGLRAGALDLAFIINILFQIENKEAFVREVLRTLRPGGRALIVDWKESYGHVGPHPDHVISEQDAQKLFTDGGFDLDRSLDAGAHHYGFLFRKPL